MKAIIGRYFSAIWWPPLAVLVASVMAMSIHPLARCFGFGSDWLPYVAAGLPLAAYAGLFVAGVVRLCRRQWWDAVGLGLIAVLLPIPLLMLLLIYGYITKAMDRNFGRFSQDPPGVEVAKPARNRKITGGQSDPEGESIILAGLNPDATRAPGLVINAPFPEFTGDNRALLLRHLATSAKWRLTRRDGRLVATRCFVVNGEWKSSYHEKEFEFPGLNEVYETAWHRLGRFRLAASLYPDGIGVTSPYQQSRTTTAAAGDGVIPVPARAPDPVWDVERYESYLLLTSGQSALELFEVNQTLARPLTQALLNAIAAELNAVVNSPVARTVGFDTALMPPFPTRSGRADLQVTYEYEHSGDYQVAAAINPGEPGYAFLKVLATSGDLPLSVEKVAESSVEYTGWSTNPRQLFSYSSEVRIEEGGFDYSYPARFELWFHPDHPAHPERKLLERVYRIYGNYE